MGGLRRRLLRCAEQSEDRLLLRLDHYTYRFDIRPAETGGVQAVAWEVKGPRELAEIRGRVTEAGYSVSDFDADQIAERRISGVSPSAIPMTTSISRSSGG